MFLDASAIVAILAREPGYEALLERLSAAQGPFSVSPLTRFEACLAIAKAKAAGRKPSAAQIAQAALVLDAFVEDLWAEDMPITPEIGQGAIEAAATWGKAVGHPAGLNFGDCFAYACAKALGAPLLYKGDDFARTDLA
jgi:ribonuclease VapC